MMPLDDIRGVYNVLRGSNVVLTWQEVGAVDLGAEHCVYK
jgi:hypothetical protein